MVKVNSCPSGTRQQSARQLRPCPSFMSVLLSSPGSFLCWSLGKLFLGGRNWHFLATLLVTFFARLEAELYLHVQISRSNRQTDWLFISWGHEDWLLHQWNWDEAADAGIFSPGIVLSLLWILSEQSGRRTVCCPHLSVRLKACIRAHVTHAHVHDETPMRTFNGEVFVFFASAQKSSLS